MAVEDHVHIGAVALFASTLAIVAVFGTIHLLALTAVDSEWARAWIALGF